MLTASLYVLRKAPSPIETNSKFTAIAVKYSISIIGLHTKLYKRDISYS
jgi:hypothetical protein